MREKVIAKKKLCEQYYVTFDYRDKDCFEPHERIRKVTVGAFDLTSDKDVSKYFLDPSKQNLGGREIFLWVREGLIGHVYRVWCHIDGSKGTRWENAMEILVEEG